MFRVPVSSLCANTFCVLHLCIGPRQLTFACVQCGLFELAKLFGDHSGQRADGADFDRGMSW